MVKRLKITHFLLIPSLRRYGGHGWRRWWRIDLGVGMWFSVWGCLNWSSNGSAKLNDLKNVKLSDICIGTSAAPTFLPAHYFETKDAKGNTRSFDLIDGGVAANNPTMMAISQIRKEMLLQNTELPDIKSMEYSKRMLVLSLGTCEAKHEEKHTAAKA
ncbi:patatin-like protein 2 isoform X2 [Fagus crenata]